MDEIAQGESEPVQIPIHLLAPNRLQGRRQLRRQTFRDHHPPRSPPAFSPAITKSSTATRGREADAFGGKNGRQRSIRVINSIGFALRLRAI